MNELRVPAVSVSISIYEAENSDDRKRLLQLTDDEMRKPGFPDQVQVYKRETDRVLTITTSQPDWVIWTWPREFDPFRAEFTKIH